MRIVQQYNYNYKLNWALSEWKKSRKLNVEKYVQ